MGRLCITRHWRSSNVGVFQTLVAGAIPACRIMKKVRRIDNGERIPLPPQKKIITEDEVAQHDICDACSVSTGPPRSLHFEWLLDCNNSNGTPTYTQLKQGKKRTGGVNAYTVVIKDGKVLRPYADVRDKLVDNVYI